MKTVTFKFKKVGFNAHTAYGEFTYTTEDGALKAYLEMKNTPGYFDVKLK